MFAESSVQPEHDELSPSHTPHSSIIASPPQTLLQSKIFPLQSQYQFNYSSINPAAVGEFDYLSIVASYRNQWLGFNTQNDQAIATQYVTFTKGL